MADLNLVTAVLGAGLFGGGACGVAAGMSRRPGRLNDLLAILGPDGGLSSTQQVVITDPSSRFERIGAWVYRRARIPLRASTAQALSLSGRSIGSLFAQKLTLALSGLALPNLLATMLYPLTGSVGIVPVGVGIGLAGLGWLWPDLRLRSQLRHLRADAEEALSTYFDLVVLERLANLSATQALWDGAQRSDVAVFRHIRNALEHARLEQRPPWHDLRTLAARLELPQIADMSDIMRLDDQGASLADLLMSRGKELRDAQLNARKVAAHQASEAMTLWMSLPVLVFALAFLIPPLMRIIAPS